MSAINPNAPVVCRKTILINASVEAVWSVLTDIDHWPEWQAEIPTAKANGPLAAGTPFKWKTGGLKIRSVLHTVEPPRYFGWKGTSVGTYAVHNWILSEKDGQTEVEVEESMDGIPVRLFRKSFQKSLESGMQTWLELLKKRCEE